MSTLRIALAPINAHVGAIDTNVELIREAARQGADAGADLICCPEMAITGYPVEDLALRRSFVAASEAALDQLACELVEVGAGKVAVVVGYLALSDSERPQNRVAVLHDGRVVASYAKHHLPNYGVFDEYRYFERGNEFVICRIRGVDVGLAICEDLWQDGGPVAAAAEAGVGLLAVVNASPFEADKDDVRGELVARRARQAGCALAYVNMTGGQDELVFDSDSMIADAAGTILARSQQFSTELLVCDVELPAANKHPTSETVAGMTVHRVSDLGELSQPLAPRTPACVPIVAERLDTHAEVWAALTMGLGDYCRKNGIEKAFLGLSGGIDSTLVGALAVDALGADRVYGISNPSKWSTGHSTTDAQDLADRTGLHLATVPIARLVEAFEAEMPLAGLAAENLQARIRAVLWMAASNSAGPSIVLACGNKSEIAVGYSTIYGDAVGGFAPIKDVYKTQVWELARWRNRVAVERGETPPIPENAISKEPSAELREGQKDSDSLPPYDLLDAILEQYVGTDKPLADMVADGFDCDLVLQVMAMTDRAEYKRRQYPPGTKISFKAFGRDRRLPVTNGFRER